MSWECNPCHKVATGKKASDVHFSGSYGRCETCGVTSNCSHCQCPGDWAAARAAAVERAEWHAE